MQNSGGPRRTQSREGGLGARSQLLLLLLLLMLLLLLLELLLVVLLLWLPLPAWFIWGPPNLRGPLMILGSKQVQQGGPWRLLQTLLQRL